MATYKGKQYRLRAGSPMPTSTAGNFVIHSFMAAIQYSNIETCTTSIAKSVEFKGRGGNFTSASYTRLALSGGLYFSGKTATNEEYEDEEGKYN